MIDIATKAIAIFYEEARRATLSKDVIDHPSHRIQRAASSPFCCCFPAVLKAPGHAAGDFVIEIVTVISEVEIETVTCGFDPSSGWQTPHHGQIPRRVFPFPGRTSSKNLMIQSHCRHCQCKRDPKER